MGSIKKRVLLAIVAMFVLSTVLVGCGRGTVAKVNGRRVSRDEYYKLLQQVTTIDPATGRPAEAGVVVLSTLVNNALTLGFAEKEGVAPTEAQVKERVDQMMRNPELANALRRAGVTKDDLKQDAEIAQARFNLITKGVTIPDKDIKAYYEEHLADRFTIPEQRDCGMIVAKNKIDADKALEMLKVKKVPFATVAQGLSIDPSAQQGGAVNGVTRDDRRLPQEAVEKLYGMKEKEISDPFPQTQRQGETEVTVYVILQMNKPRKPRTRSFSEVRYNIREQLMVEKGQEKNDDLMTKMRQFREKADIKVSIDRYEPLFKKEEPKKK